MSVNGRAVDPWPLIRWLHDHGHRGAAYAVGRDYVAAAMGVSTRELRAMAEASRLAGNPEGVVAYSTRGNKGGLYLCAGKDEIEALLRQVTRHCLARLRQRSALKRALAKPGQRELWPEDGARV